MKTGLKARGAVVVVSASNRGPVAHRFDSMGYAASWLMSLARYPLKLDTETIWTRQGGGWVPAFPWQHKADA